MVPFHMLHIVSYCAIVTLPLRRAVFTTFFKKFHDLEMGVKGHSRSLRVVSFDRLCMVSYKESVLYICAKCDADISIRSKVVRGSKNFEIRSRDLGLAHLRVVL